MFVPPASGGAWTSGRAFECPDFYSLYTRRDMSRLTAKQQASLDRRRRIQQVVCGVLRDYVAVDLPDEDPILARHPDLMPELGRELEKLRRITWALDRAEQEQGRRALGRLRSDWAHDRADDLRSAVGPNSASGSPESSLADGASAGRQIGSSSETNPTGRDDAITKDSQLPVELPTRTARYQVEQLLGEGGFGRIYRA